MKVEIFKILKVTAGGFHAICESNIGRIRKENRNVPQYLWDIFEEKKPIEPVIKPEIKLKWYQRIWLKLKKLYYKIIKL